MAPGDNKRFALLMFGLADNFRDSISEAGMKMRWEMLKPFSIQQVEAACKQIILTRKFTKMPTIADFIEAIEGSANERAEIQAHLILSTIREIGAYQTPSFEDPVTRELTSRRWTWPELCQLPTADHQWFVKEFIQAYQTYQHHEKLVAIGSSNQNVRLLADGLAKKMAAER